MIEIFKLKLSLNIDIDIKILEATAVVQVEDTRLLEKREDGKEEKVIEILSDPKDGQDIR